MPSPLFVAALGMGVVFVFLVFLSTMMAALTAVAGRPTEQSDTPEPVTVPHGPGSPGWIAAATAVFFADDQAVDQLRSGAPWRPYDTVDSVRWRMKPLSANSVNVPRHIAP